MFLINPDEKSAHQILDTAYSSHTSLTKIAYHFYPISPTIKTGSDEACLSWSAAVIRDGVVP